MTSAVADVPDVFVGRQPIFDRGQHTVGYEILFRDSRLNVAGIDDGSLSTASVVLGALTEIGLDRLVGGTKAWVNLTRDAVLGGLGLALPPRSTCFELLEGQAIDAGVIAALGSLKASGYQLALDDFEFTPELQQVLPLADFVKLDYVALGPERFSEQLALLAPYDVSVVAEKVETPEGHRHCMSLGCALFQGFFYQRPEVLSERRIELTRGSTFELIAALQDPGLDLDGLEPLIVRDTRLSLRLLRYLNSAFLGLSCEVSSIRQALVLLGVQNVRRWATLTAMSGFEGKPTELTKTSLQRARFCELAGAAAGLDGAELFTVGMFSLIDALMDLPLSTLLAALPLRAEIGDALLSHAGPMGAILAAAVAFETDAPDVAAAGVTDTERIYLEALLWAQQASGPLLNDHAAA